MVHARLQLQLLHACACKWAAHADEPHMHMRIEPLLEVWCNLGQTVHLAPQCDFVAYNLPN